MLRYKHILTISGFIFISVSACFAGTEYLTPRLEISGEYTDNLYIANTDPQEEFIYIFSPGFDYSATVKDGGLDVSYTTNYTTYSQSDEDPFWGHDATVHIYTNPEKHTRAEFYNFFLWSNERYQKSEYSLLGYLEYEDQLYPILDTTLRTGLNEYYTNTAAADLTHQFTEQNSLSFRALASIRNELNSEYNNDNRRYKPSVNLTYWLSPHLGVDMSAIYTRGVFANSSNFNDYRGLLTLRRIVSRHTEIFLEYDQIFKRYDVSSDDNYNYYAGTGGITYETDNALSLSAGLGYFFQDNKTDQNESGFFFDADADKAWITPHSEIHIIGSTGMDRSEFGSENLGLERYYGLSTSASYYFTRTFTAGIHGTARISEYLNIDPNRTEYFGNAGCSFTYIPQTWLTVSAAYNRNLIRGREAGNYDENSVILNFSFIPKGIRYN